MKYVAAYILLKLAGKDKVAEKDLSDFLKKIDSDVNEEQVKSVVTALEGKDLSELAKNGLTKISSMAVSAPSAAAPKTAVAAESKAAAKKEEPKEEEADYDMGDMFG